MRIAVLPFVNFTELADARERIGPIVRQEFLQRQVDLVPEDELRKALRADRIRTQNGISHSEARQVGWATGAEFLALGSFDLLSPDVPEVVLSLRLLHVATGRIVAAASAAATGEDFAGLFGFGRIEHLDPLARRVIRDLFAQIDEQFRFERLEEAVTEESARVAIVPYEDLSGMASGGGSVFSAILLSRLVAAGFDVVEPGVVEDLFVRNHRVFRGEIDREMQLALTAELKVEFVITGTVTTWEPLTEWSPQAIPRLEIGSRALDSEAGRLVWSREDLRDGRSSEGILRIGRHSSIGRVADKTAKDIVSDLAKWIDSRVRPGTTLLDNTEQRVAWLRTRRGTSR